MEVDVVELGMVGLGRMGGAMARRLVQGGHTVVAYDRLPESVAAAEGHGARAAGSIQGMVARLSPPRAVWVMVPAGAPTEEAIHALADSMSPGDLVVDGGNSNYRESVRRAQGLRDQGLHFLDVGTSGGIWGLEHGYSLMVGGEPEAYRLLEPALRTLAPAPDRGYGLVGPAGAGHYVKMVHNAVEYALMEAYAEGFELMRAKEGFRLDLAQVAEIWRHGSVVRSWLLDLAAGALEEEPGLDSVEPYVEDSGEGRWAVEESVALGVPAPAIVLALQARFRSQQERPFGARLLAAMRSKFGGHPVRRVR